MELVCCPRSTLSGHIIKSQSNHQTFRKLQLRHYSASSNSSACHSVFVMRPKPSNVCALQRLSDHGMVINPVKCVFGVSELDFLGHHVSEQGIQPLEEKVRVIRAFPNHCLPGLVNFYHHFIPNGADVLQPLNKLLSSPENTPRHLAWDQESTTAFNTIKQVLTEATLLVHPKPNAPTSIMADASDSAVGAVLQQYINNSWYQIAYTGTCAQQR